MLARHAVQYVKDASIGGHTALYMQDVRISDWAWLLRKNTPILKDMKEDHIRKHLPKDVTDLPMGSVRRTDARRDEVRRNLDNAYRRGKDQNGFIAVLSAELNQHTGPLSLKAGGNRE